MDWGFVYVVLLSAVEIFADFQLKWYTQTDALSHLGWGVAGYAAVVILLIEALRHANVLYVNALWDGMSGLIESIAAYAILGDRLKSSQQYVGVLFIIVGVILLKMGH